MSKTRLLIPLTQHFSVRYLLRTGLLRRVSEYAVPLILLGWEDEELQRELEVVGAEVYRIPGIVRGTSYNRVRDQINVWHRKRLASPSTAIDERRQLLQAPLGERWRRRVRQNLYGLRLAWPGTAEALRQQERELFWQDSNAKDIDAWLANLRADAGFSLTPYIPDEEFVLRVCARRGMPLCTAILSFDNITTRGWIPVNFDRYLLWNSYNESELLRAYPQVSPASITIVGAPQFDFYWDQSYLWEEDAWRQRLALPAGRPVILYGAGHFGIVPHEPHFLWQMDEAIEKREIQNHPIILFRRHPVDPVERWAPLRKQTRHVVYDDAWLSPKVLGRTNIKREDIEKLASNLNHSAVHVNVSSTMTVDGAIFDRPQIGPAYDDRPGRKYDRVARELYLREHYLPITHSEGLDVVHSRQEMIAAINRALAEPSRSAEGRERIIREICTFNDGRSTERVDRALSRFLSKHESATNVTATSELAAV